MNTTYTYVKCPGSGLRTGGWPEDDDVCPVCQKWVRIRLDSGLRAHGSRRKTRKVTIEEPAGLSEHIANGGLLSDWMRQPFPDGWGK